MKEFNPPDIDELWSSMDELEFQMGDMHGIAFKPKTEKNPCPTKPIKREKVPEKRKKHIKRDGRR